MRVILLTSVLSAFIFTVLGDSCSNSDSKTPDLNFEEHFKKLSDKRHPLYKDGGPWREGKKYVAEVFRRDGCRDVREQHFNVTYGVENIEGTNIICVVEGLNRTGPVMVVGADLGTSLVSNHLKDNTGGVASLLEVMHLFFDRIYWNCYELNFTVVFVAFDLNTKEFQDSGWGQPGSNIFLKNWLLPFLESPSEKAFQGAIILDSITTFNTENGTQTLADGFEKAMPDAYKNIVDSGKKGDFMGFLYTTREKNNPIVKAFPKHWNKDRKGRPYRLQEMQATLSFDTLADDITDRINHQAHYHFWTHVEKPLPAVLLFDTDSDREDPNPCRVEVGCTVEEFLTKQRIDFLSKVTNTVMDTVLELQATFVESSSSGAPSMTVLVLIALTSLSMLRSSFC